MQDDYVELHYFKDIPIYFFYHADTQAVALYATMRQLCFYLDLRRASVGSRLRQDGVKARFPATFKETCKRQNVNQHGTNHGVYDLEDILLFVKDNAHRKSFLDLQRFIERQKEEFGETCLDRQPGKKRRGPRKEEPKNACPYQPGQLVELCDIVDGQHCFTHAYFQQQKDDSTAILFYTVNTLVEVPLAQVHLPRGPIHGQQVRGHNVEIFKRLGGADGWFPAYYLGSDPSKPNKALVVPHQAKDGKAEIFSISTYQIRQVTDRPDGNPKPLKRYKK